jgi:anti-anti-sigma factor
MQIAVHPLEWSISVTVVGDLDLYGAQILTSTLDELLQQGLPIALDIAGVGFMDSAAVVAIEALATEAQIRGIQVHVAEAGPAVHRILALTGVQTWTRSATALPPA